MDSARFDTLARSLTARATSRRAALTAVLGGSLGALVFTETEAGDAKKRRKKKLKRQRRFCNKVANGLAQQGAVLCQWEYQYVNPALIPACIAAYYSCLPYTRACNTQAAQACFAAFHEVW